jgi:hypothetical protein
MKSSNIKPCECGSTEFITKPNSYDIYELIEGELEYQRSEYIDDEIKYYCRDCSKELSV